MKYEFNYPVVFRGITHYSFTDLPLVVPSFIGRKIGLQGSTDALLCLKALVEISIHFLTTNFDGDEFDIVDVKNRYDFIVEGSTLEITKPGTVAMP